VLPLFCAYLQEGGPTVTFDEAQQHCKESVKGFAHIELVYGRAG